MPKNKGKGGKNYRKGKHSVPGKKDLVLKDSDEGLEYGRVQKMLGNGRVVVKCFDQVVRLGHIRGKMKRKIWINQGDIVLCSLREFQNKKCDVILKYLPEQIKQLRAIGQIPQSNTESSNTTEIEFRELQAVQNQSQSGSDSQDDEDDSQNEQKIQEKVFKKKVQEKKAEINIDDI